MGKNISLTEEEIELLTIALRCMDEERYNMFTTSYKTYSEVKEQKNSLRVKLINALYGE